MLILAEKSGNGSISNLSTKVFDEKLAAGDYVACSEAACGRYAYEFVDLLAPSRERGHVCIFPALAESDVGLELQRRQRALGEFTCATVYFACAWASTPAHEVSS